MTDCPTYPVRAAAGRPPGGRGRRRPRRAAPGAGADRGRRRRRTWCRPEVTPGDRGAGGARRDHLAASAASRTPTSTAPGTSSPRPTTARSTSGSPRRPRRRRIFCVRADDATRATRLDAGGRPARRRHGRRARQPRSRDPRRSAACATRSSTGCATARSLAPRHQRTDGRAWCWSAADRATPS